MPGQVSLRKSYEGQPFPLLCLILKLFRFPPLPSVLHCSDIATMPYLSDPTIAAPYKAEYASYITGQQVHTDISQLSSDAREKVINPEPPAKVDPKQLKVGIIGAGCAGLYSALLLQYLGIPFEILESSERAGGRVLTHYFTDERPSHDYYDIGAMRFPKTPIMDRTFDLFQRMGVNKKLIPYLMNARDNKPQWARYNDITAMTPAKGDPFEVSTKNKGPVPYENVLDPDEITNEAYNRFRNKIKKAIDSKEDPEGLKRAWEFLMRHDKFSLRDYLNFVEGQDPETIHWLETLQSATGWFDQAFTENVLESLAFDYEDDGKPTPDPKTIEGKDGQPLKNGNWYCVEGGTSELIIALEQQFPDQIQYKKRVTKMALVRLNENDDGKNCVEVFVKGEEKPRQYASVINTTTLAALQKMDLTGMEFHYRLKAAIRSLHYDTSSKVGMKFSYPWWIKDKGVYGGLGKTDMPLRVW